jgi:peptidyl-prolyl cis-trans isomerase NIMA-interacting 1
MQKGSRVEGRRVQQIKNIMPNSNKVRAAHLLIKHTGSRNPVSRRTGAAVTLPPNAAMEELLQYEHKIQKMTSEDGTDLSTVFRRFAEERSDCSSFKNGGDLGEFARGDMQKAFEDASFALQPGQMSCIVSTDSGYHLIYRIS